MRDRVESLIKKISKTDARILIAEKRLQKALSEYENVFGQEGPKERLEEYRSIEKELEQ